MEDERLIPLERICSNYGVGISFIRSLDEYGLIRIVYVNETAFIEEDRLGEMEKILHLHYDLEINLQGIDAIRHLLDKVERLQRELNEMRNKIG